MKKTFAVALVALGILASAPAEAGHRPHRGARVRHARVVRHERVVYRPARVIRHRHRYYRPAYVPVRPVVYVDPFWTFSVQFGNDPCD